MSYIPGDFWRICDRSGFKVRASQTRREWNGLIVREQDYEERHPQDFVRGRKDRQNVPDPRPEPTILAERDGYRAAYLAVATQLGSLRQTAAPWVRPPDHTIPQGQSIFVVTLPKSGTVFIGHSLKQTLGYDFTSTLVTPTWPKNIVWPSMAWDFMRGGMVSVSHMQPDLANITALFNAGISKVVLHVRDPRAALHSWFHFLCKRQIDSIGLPRDHDTPITIDPLIESYFRPALAWISGWLEAIEDHPRMNVLVKTHDDLARDERGYLLSVIEFHDLSAPAIQTVGKNDTTHFRAGNNTDWRSTFTPEQVDRVSSMIQDKLWERFQWPK